MSVKDRRRQFEQHVEEHEDTRRELHVMASSSNEAPESRPILPPRPTSKLDVPKRTRPPVPPKSKSISGNVINAGRQNVDDSSEILLIDFEHGADGATDLKHVDPVPVVDDGALCPSATPNSRLSSNDHVVPQRGPSPLASVGAGLLKLRVGTTETLDKAGVPQLFRTVSGNTQTTLQKVQADAPKAWQGFTGTTQKAFQGVQKVGSDVGVGIKRTISGVPVPEPFARTGEDLADLTKLSIGQPGICSRCATLPLENCFSEKSESEQAYIPWSTPLSRVALHAQWCRLCQLFLSMLCRPQHDPLLLPEVRDFIEPEWLRGVPLQKWVSEGYINQDKYWPFGRSEYRHEGSTLVVGPLAEALWGVAKQSSGVGMKLLARSAVGRRPHLTAKDFQKRSSQRYREGYRMGKEENSRFPISCVIMVTVSAKSADIPGLLWVDLVGCSNAPGAEQKALSHFMLRAVKDGFAVTVSPDRPLSYGHALDPSWIDVSICKLWLSECETRHGTQCSEHGWAVAMRKPGFLRLIDLQNLNIVVASEPEACRYVALSYVWGGAEMVKLRYSNLDQLSRPKGLVAYLPQLPRTIIDAMEVVKDVGERYLWVDALCILQENTEESREQIANMDSVYGSALLTIVAGGGDSAYSGLDGVRRQYFPQSGRSACERRAVRSSANVNNGMQVLAPTDSSQTLETTAWNSRAWTFQERLLSRRLVTFADQEMVWHCRCMMAREDMPIEDTGYTYAPLEWLNLKRAYLGVGTDSHWKDGSIEVTRHGLTHVVRSGTFAEYARMIQQYSCRKITYDSDAINALTGLLKIFSLCFQSECLYGLPTILLDVALLWRPLEPLARRGGETNFPSWSWAAWKGRVAYGLLTEIKRNESGQMMEIEGIRPLLRYFVLDKQTGALLPLNGTSRGLPIAESEMPAEWEAHARKSECRSTLHTCQSPELFDLDPRTIPSLSDRHLVFWTSTSDAFSLKEIPPQRVDFMWSSRGQTRRMALLEPLGNEVGSVLLDGSGPARLQSGTHRLLLMAEAHGSQHDVELTKDDFSYYLVMLVETNQSSGISSRLGVGRLFKPAWELVMPTLSLICLG